MKTLLLVAHGSRLESSNDAVKDLTLGLRDKLFASDFVAAEYAFLELTKPTIPDGISKLATQNASEIVVLPYFLAPGTHVVDDLPELVERARAQYPEITFKVMPHLGAVDGMIDLILDSADSAA